MFPHALHITPAGWVHLLLFGVFLPVMALRSARLIAKRKMPLPPRLVHFQSTSVVLFAFLSLSVATALVQRMPLFPPGVSHPWRGLAAGAAMYLAAVLIMRPRWRAAVACRARAVHLFVADTRPERAWWVVVSLLAGVGEEITWRGVQTALLVPVVGSYWMAALLSAVAFAVAHAVQGWKSGAAILAFALGFQAVVVASGSLYVAMAVHVAYDLTAGLTYGRLAREMGYVPDL
jgi:membrane protease YdiL (CAAX protease family)